MTYLLLFWTFFKIGLFTIGGGYAMIPLINESVLEHGWLSQEMLIDFIAVSESTPGPFAINIATFVGAKVAGFFGAVLSTLGVVLPSFIIIFLIANFFIEKMKKQKLYNDAMDGLRPAVVGLIASAFITIAISTFFSAESLLSVDFSKTDFIAIILFAVVFLISLIKKPKKIPAILLIVISAALGILAYGVILPNI